MSEVPMGELPQLINTYSKTEKCRNPKQTTPQGSQIMDSVPVKITWNSMLLTMMFFSCHAVASVPVFLSAVFLWAAVYHIVVNL